jgi:RNA polymerase sigma-70 factor (ECF subfamily)
VKLSDGLFVLPVKDPNTHDLELLRRSQAGDAGAFDELIRRLTPRLFRIIRRMASDAAEAEALVQETWVRAWRGLSRWRGDGEPIAWLAAIAVNQARDRWRKKAPIDFADLGEGAVNLQDDAAGPEETAESHEALVKLARGVAGLRPEQRAAIALRYEAGLTYDQVAAAMGIPMNTVRTHLHRAKAALREWMEAGDVGLDG